MLSDLRAPSTALFCPAVGGGTVGMTLIMSPLLDKVEGGGLPTLCLTQDTELSPKSHQPLIWALSSGEEENGAGVV